MSELKTGQDIAQMSINQLRQVIEDLRRMLFQQQKLWAEVHQTPAGDPVWFICKECPTCGNAEPVDAGLSETIQDAECDSQARLQELQNQEASHV